MAKTVVLGAGVVGVACAYYLARAGREVLVLERQAQAGLETSFANAGLLTPGHAVPWAGPDVPLKMLKWLSREDAPLRFRLFADPAQWRWLLRFLGNCTRARFETHAARLIELALYNQSLLRELRSAAALDDDVHAPGLLHIFDDARVFDAARTHAAFMTRHGVAQHPLDTAACLRIEPALARCAYPIAGAIHTPDDACGDALKFTQGLARHAAERGVEFRYGCTIRGLALAGDAVRGVHTDAGELPAEAVVLSLGSYSPALARQAGLRLPVHPLKGYSVTVPLSDPGRVPSVSLYEERHKIGVSRLGDRLRAGGTAEFARFDTSLNAVRGRALLDALQALVPAGLDLARTTHWAGLRPMSPDGMPILGPSGAGGLYLATGHGTLGWTLACASGKVLADLLCGRTPQVEAGAFDLQRFHP
ncbi:MAG: D-amino acid dehydrogenase [Candidatus Lambdaproteobacteria bacterium]|nr:D-amino acid dehydrogenase [Candidatus Lambdaproteobacteria bacterium]